MTKPTKKISEKKRYVLRMLDMMENDPQIKELKPNPEVRTAICAEPTLDRMIDAALTGYSDRPALGERAYEMITENGINQRNYLPSFKTITYAEFQARLKALATAWRHHPVHQINPSEFVGILGFTGIDFVTLDLACAYAYTVTIPLQSLSLIHI